jgi:hypothetical protein
MDPRLEEIAEELLAAVGARPPVSARALAHWCGLTLATRNCELSAVRGCALIIDGNAPEREQEAALAVHIAHWRLARAGYDDLSDRAVEYEARALLLPREAFARDMRRNPEFAQLERIHRYASARFIRARALDLAELAPSLRLVVG